MYGDDVGSVVDGDADDGVDEYVEEVQKVSATNEREADFPCVHTTWRRIDKVKLKDRIEFLKECRRCQHKRVFVVTTTFGQSRVFVGQSYYDPPHHRNRS